MLLELPQFAVVALCIMAAFLPPLVMAYLVHLVLPGDRVKSFAGAEPAIIGTVSLLFGLFAAFLANDIWTRNQMARQSLFEEGDAIRNLARLAEGDADVTATMRTALAAYIDAVVAKDWPAMRAGKHSKGILPKVRAISTLIVSGPVATGVGPVVQAKMLEAFTTMRERRQTRTFLAEERNFTIKWHALILFGVLTQLAITITHLTKPRPMLLAHMVFGCALATCLVILVTNEFPYSSLNPIDPDPLLKARESLFRE